MATIKAVLIDPLAETVTDVEYNGDYKQIYKHIQAELFTVVRLKDDDDVFVDDEGLLHLTKDSRFFVLPDYPQPLVGRGLVLGNDPESGESTDCHHDAAYYRDRVVFVDIGFVQAATY
jgi:hypothetical protein